MRQKSLLSTALVSVFSVIGLLSNAIAVSKGDCKIAAIAAMIYVFPLFVDAIEELSTMHILTLIQHRILIFSVHIGISHLILLFGYCVLQVSNINIIAGAIGILFKVVLIALPAVYTVSKIYDLRVALKQNENVAKAYCK